MFSDERQLAAVCRTLLASVRLENLWGEHEPTEDAAALLEADGGPLSSGERGVLLVAFALWNGNTRLPFAAVLHLDSRRLVLMAELLLALASGPEAIDRWLSTERW